MCLEIVVRVRIRLPLADNYYKMKKKVIMEKYEITYNLSSLEGRFTDFDQWIQSLQENFEKRSSQRNTAAEKTHEETIDNTFIFKLQELHVEGIVTHTATQKQFLLNNINDLRKNYNDYIYFDYILYKLLNNENNKKKFIYRYMTSKL